MIENAFRYMARDNPELGARIRRKQDEEMGLMVEMERKLLRARRGWRERWE